MFYSQKYLNPIYQLTIKVCGRTSVWRQWIKEAHPIGHHLNTTSIARLKSRQDRFWLVFAPPESNFISAQRLWWNQGLPTSKESSPLLATWLLLERSSSRSRQEIFISLLSHQQCGPLCWRFCYFLPSLFLMSQSKVRWISFRNILFYLITSCKNMWPQCTVILFFNSFMAVFFRGKTD